VAIEEAKDESKEEIWVLD